MAKFLNSLLLIAFLAITTTIATTHAELIGIRVTGLLTCSVPGSFPTGPPLVGVNVTLSCNGGQTTLGQALTNTGGFFNIVLTTIDGLAFDQSNCAVYAQLTPILNCTVFPPTQILRSAIDIVGLVPSALGAILNCVSIGFGLITFT